MTWQSRLLNWYRAHRRDLPWRRTGDPYKIWVSEIMLQQTTVAAVIPYYERFLERFPTIRSLAEASEDEVLKFWSGLGYYSRARNLRRAAQMIVQNYGGKLPDSVEHLLTLPGIGRYTAGAIASIAFEKQAPILDGNVIRVLSRLFRIKENPKSSAGQKIFWGKAKDILPKKNIGDFNQALMELGATLCLPENPFCPICPVYSFCEAAQSDDPKSFPCGKKKKDYRDVIMTAAIVQREDKLLLIQRSNTKFLSGMREFPTVEGEAQELLKAWPFEIVRPLPIVRHSVMNRRIRITPVLCQLNDSTPLSDFSHRWILPSELSDLPTSSANKKILERFKELI